MSTFPHNKFIGNAAKAQEEADRIVSEGGFAWTVAEHGSDMGGPDVYWGHSIYYFTAEEIQERMAFILEEAGERDG